jgi:hypothetical protein
VSHGTEDDSISSLKLIYGPVLIPGTSQLNVDWIIYSWVSSMGAESGHLAFLWIFVNKNQIIKRKES